VIAGMFETLRSANPDPLKGEELLQDDVILQDLTPLSVFVSVFERLG
jgi:hypothetical protein